MGIADGANVGTVLGSDDGDIEGNTLGTGMGAADGD